VDRLAGLKDRDEGGACPYNLFEDRDELGEWPAAGAELARECRRGKAARGSQTENSILRR
jgi:hypothetical protein